MKNHKKISSALKKKKKKKGVNKYRIRALKGY
jgi:hypothetical protein